MSRPGYSGFGRTSEYPSMYDYGGFDRSSFERSPYDNRSPYYGSGPSSTPYDYYNSYSGYPGRYEPYPPRFPGPMGGGASPMARRMQAGAFVSGMGSKLPRNANGNQKGQQVARRNMKGGVRGDRRNSQRRSIVTQFCANRSGGPPFMTAPQKWGSSNSFRSSWMFPRFKDFLKGDDIPLWLTEADLQTNYPVPEDNTYCADCGCLVIVLAKHKKSEFHKEKVEEKKGITPKWKMEFAERLKRYEERKAAAEAKGEKAPEEDDDENNDEHEGNEEMDTNGEVNGEVAKANGE